MFSRIQTRHFRSLKAVDRSLAPFQALVGPNASGKTTFLDVIAFLGELMRNRGDVLRTVRERSSVFESLLWKGEGEAFQLAVEATIPNGLRHLMGDDKQGMHIVRYEVEVGIINSDIGLNRETLWLGEASAAEGPVVRELFPAHRFDVRTILQAPKKGWKTAINKKPDGNDNYYTEGKKSYQPSFKLGRTRSALANLPADEDSFPISTWFRRLLEEGVQTFILNSQVIRQPSAPGMGRGFKPDGSNLPWVVAELRKDAERFQKWLEHVRTALEDIIDITVIERPEDRHAYLVIHYANGAKVPSWLASDGTLRMLALTIPAYLTELEGVFLIEEPENGVHPKALETVLQSLMSIRNCQVLIATHSPVALNMLEARDILCFAKDSEGATDIVSGLEHPALQEWKLGEPSLGILFASGVLS
jgi:predicted ATPase